MDIAIRAGEGMGGTRQDMQQLLLEGKACVYNRRVH